MTKSTYHVTVHRGDYIVTESANGSVSIQDPVTKEMVTFRSLATYRSFIREAFYAMDNAPTEKPR
jgi:hypothetical protein